MKLRDCDNCFKIGSPTALKMWESQNVMAFDLANPVISCGVATRWSIFHWLEMLNYDPTVFKVPYLRSKGTDCYEWDVVGKLNHGISNDMTLSIQECNTFPEIEKSIKEIQTFWRSLVSHC